MTVDFMFVRQQIVQQYLLKTSFKIVEKNVAFYYRV